jgi:hypothetical protein
LEEEAAKMARANPQALGQNFHTAVLKATLTNQPQAS